MEIGHLAVDEEPFLLETEIVRKATSQIVTIKEEELPARQFRFPPYCARCGAQPANERYFLFGAQGSVLTTESHVVRVPVCKTCLDWTNGKHLCLIRRFFFNPKAFVVWSDNFQTLVFSDQDYLAKFKQLNP